MRHLPGLPGNKKEAVVGCVNAIGAALAEHGVAVTKAAAAPTALAVVLGSGIMQG